MIPKAAIDLVISSVLGSVPLRAPRWSELGGRGSAETTVALPISESVPVRLELAKTPAESGDGAVVTELFGDQGRTTANRIAVHLE